MSCKTKTINLANITLDKLKKNARKQQNSYQAVECTLKKPVAAESVPPLREIRFTKLQVCRPRIVDYVQPPIPCICPPCPPCPSRHQQMKRLAKLGIKLGLFYFLFEASRKKGIWGNPDGTSKIATNLSNMITKVFRDDPNQKEIFGGDRIGLIELDRLKYRLATAWDKTIVFIFTWTIGRPVQLMQGFLDKVEDAAESGFGTRRQNGD